MAKPVWKVVLVKKPANSTYSADYFPRKFCYKFNAERLKEEVEQSGGEAQVIKEV